MEINKINTLPNYINTFLNKNIKDLLSIYEQGIKENKSGNLGMKCSQKNNIMDVFFLNDKLSSEFIPKDTYEKIEKNKKLFIIQDLDLKSIFLVYN